MNTVRMPPALRQRNIQLQALDISPVSPKPDLLLPQPIKIESMENHVKHRKKQAVIVDDVNQVSSTGNTTSDEDSGSEDSIIETYLVIEFKPDIQKKTLHWIIDKLRTKTSRGGAGLKIRREPQTE